MEDLAEKIRKDTQTTTALTAQEKSALQKMEDIGKNSSLTVQQQVDQVKSIFSALSEMEQQKIRDFLRSELPPRPSPSPQ
ncbi:unnamed protein product [Gongylonema pulchrum]|uniref:DUF2887 domain-containing protein n=1 Tax=Gongylonema pulchrum TaxID=637853 RepID=A0A183EYD0_9BILA|nr:unnamed protein product [Gongylonema pulchrum]